MVKKTKKTILILIILFSIVYSSNVLLNHWREIYAKLFPCKIPILYSVLEFDKRFKISKPDFIKALKEAENIWEKPLAIDFFEYSELEKPGGIVEVNLVYDSRQEATDKISNLGIKVDNSKHSYDELKDKYEILQSDFEKDKASFDERSQTFNETQEAYMKEVEEWNKKGGAPKEIYEKLNSEMESLKKEYEELKVLENNLNEKIESINALVAVINKTARNLNISTETLNNINKERGEEFTQGEYIEGNTGGEINIYEFSTYDKLVRVLAHEFGHALGLDHIEDKEAIMYRLNENKNGKLTTEDILAVKSLCKNQ